MLFPEYLFYRSKATLRSTKVSSKGCQKGRMAHGLQDGNEGTDEKANRSDYVTSQQERMPGRMIGKGV